MPQEDGITLRRASAEDAGALVPLFEQLGYPPGSGVIRERLNSQENDTQIIVAARDGGTSGAQDPRNDVRWKCFGSNSNKAVI